MSRAHSRLVLHVANENLPLKEPFRISGYVFHDSPAILVTLREGNLEGRGEAAGVYYLDDKPEHAGDDRGKSRGDRSGLTREQLRSLLPAGGARNAVDCALWELESRRAGPGLANGRDRNAARRC